MKNFNNKQFPKFSLEVIKVLSKKFPETFFVGGAVRNILLNQKIADIDIATSAHPMQIEVLLKNAGIKFSNEHKNMGVIMASRSKQTLEITTFRKEVYGKTRFPKVAFVTNPKLDSQRRDFTVNAFYYSPISKRLLDFHGGLKDISLHQLKFIGNTKKKIEEDPLRIVRAFRFQLQYNLQIDKKTLQVLHTNINLLKKVSKTRLQKEINSVTSQKLKKQLQKVIHSNA